LMALNGSFRARGVMPRCSGGGFHGTSGIYPETPAMMDEFLRIYSAAVRSLGMYINVHIICIYKSG